MPERSTRLHFEWLECRRYLHGDDLHEAQFEGQALESTFIGTLASLVPGALITEGPVLGAVSEQAGKVFVRTSVEASITVEVSTSAAFTSSQFSAPQRTLASRDLTTIIPLPGLTADTQYFYRVYAGGVLQQTTPHKFRTFPTPGTSHDLTFAVAADLINVRSNPDVAAPVYSRIADDDPTFLLQIGDFDHRNPTSLGSMRNMHRDVLGPRTASGADFANNIAPNMPLFHVYDDHDYGMDNGDKTFPGRAAALQAFQEYYATPALANPQAGIWHSFAVGNVDVFMLDTRSQRDPDGTADGPAKSMLDGDNIAAGQKQWFKSALLDSTATWKFVISTVPFNPTAKPHDSWGAFATERTEILNFIESNGITGVIFISADMHSGGAIDDGTNSGLPEINVPHTNATASNVVTGGDPGTWSEGLISGKGNPGYALITVTADPPTVLLEAKGVDGLVRSSLQVRLPAAPDDQGPAVTQLTVSPANASAPPTLIAVASDAGRGDSAVVRAEYFIDVVGAKGTGKPLSATDGEYDSPTESIRAVVNAGDFAALANGAHTIYVRAKDTAGNWGVTSSTTFQKMAPAAAQYYLSMPIAGTVQNSNGTSFTFAASDIVKLSVDSSGQYTYSMFLNGADVGLTLESENVDAISVRPDGSVLVSTTGAFSVASKYSAPAVGSGTAITGAGEDLLRFMPSATGNSTTGSWSLFFDGSAVGLVGTTENVDAVGVLPDGRLLLSTSGAYTVPGFSGRDEDLLAFSTATRSWTLYFDGQDVGLSGTESEDVDAVFVGSPEVTGGNPPLLISTRGQTSISGANGGSEDVLTFRATSLGSTTAGAFDSSLAFDGSVFGLGPFGLSGFQPVHTSQLQALGLSAVVQTVPPEPKTIPPSAAAKKTPDVASERLATSKVELSVIREIAVEQVFARYGVGMRVRSRRADESLGGHG